MIPTAKIREKLKWYWKNPCDFVQKEFKTVPDTWQEKALFDLVDPNKDKISLQASAGVGKSAYLAWSSMLFFACKGRKHHHPKGVAVSGLGYNNLRDNLWAEISIQLKRSALLQQMFEWNSGSYYLKGHSGTWFMSARAFAQKASPEEKAAVLSGLHSPFPLYLLDEAGSMHTKMLNVCEQGLTTAEFGKILMAGNPTDPSGLLAHASNSPEFTTHKISSDPDDPNRSRLVPKARAQAHITKMGRDDPWVRVYVLGQFPDKAFDSLFSEEVINAAMKKDYKPQDYEYSCKRIGLDVARFGDDSTMKAKRQGLRAWPIEPIYSPKGPKIAQEVVTTNNEWGGDAMTIVDGTGGHGATVVDSCEVLGYSTIEADVSSDADNKERFFNKRAEIYFRLSEWLERGGSLPDDKRLKEELLATCYTYRGRRIILEPKNMIKTKLRRSPDKADALALTFWLKDTFNNSVKSMDMGRDEKFDYYSWREKILNE